MKSLLALTVAVLLAGCATFTPKAAVHLTTQLAVAPVLLDQAAAIVRPKAATWPEADKLAMQQDMQSLTIGVKQIASIGVNPAGSALNALGRFQSARPAYLDAYKLVQKHWGDFDKSQQATLLDTDKRIRALDASLNAALSSTGLGLNTSDVSNLASTANAMTQLGLAIANAQPSK